MATADELTQREAELQRNQLAWKNTKADLERQCLNVKAQIEQLLPRLEKLRADVADEQGEKADLINRHKELQQKIANLSNDLKVSETKISDANAELARIDKLVANRKEGVDAEISQYKQLAQADADESLKTTKDTLEQAEKELEAVEILLTSTQGKLEDVQTALTDTFEKVDKQNIEIARLQQKEKDLKARIEPLQEVVDGLEEQIKLKKHEADEWEQKVNDFKAYEDKAWKALKAKDKSLQERASEVERLEQFAINKQSFLPPR